MGGLTLIVWKMGLKEAVGFFLLNREKSFSKRKHGVSLLVWWHWRCVCVWVCDISVDLWGWERVIIAPLDSMIQRSSVSFKSHLQHGGKNGCHEVRLICIPILTLSLKRAVTWNKIRCPLWALESSLQKWEILIPTAKRKVTGDVGSFVARNPAVPGSCHFCHFSWRIQEHLENDTLLCSYGRLGWS